MKPCTVCETEREESTLDSHGRCPFCQDTPPPEPPPEPENYLTAPKPRKKPVYKQPAPAQAEAQEAIPYTPPAYVQATSPQQELANRELARRRLLPFIQRFRPKYLPGWAHEDICRRLERFMKDVEEQRSPRLLIMLPPRFGKSEIGSRHFPPWVLGHHPDWEIIATSHTASLTLSFSRYIRDVMRDPGYHAVFPATRLDPSSQSVENWNLTGGGGYLAAGVGTGITGRGCLAPYTCVDTPNGLQSIIEIKVGDTVYGYQHESQKVVGAKVVGVQVSKRVKHLLKHGNIVLTTDHRIFNAARGFYTHAGEEPRLLGLWRKEGGTCAYVQSVLFSPESEVNHRVKLRQLWEGFHSSEGRASKISGSAWRRGTKLLLSKLLRRIQGEASSFLQQGKRFMYTVWEAARRVREEQILQLRMLLDTSRWEPSAQGRLQRGVLGSTSKSGFSRQRLSPVWEGSRGEVRGTSRGLRPGAQRIEQSDTALYGVSPQVSSVHGVSARQLAELLHEEDFVIDIQTETGNFFTEGLLVHNCHILLLDDLVKDIEAADSQTITDNTWEWYGSTAYTRLAPGAGVLGIMTWWSEQDWAGRIQEVMKSGEGDRFEIVRYPAINDEGDEYLLPDDHIVQIPSGSVVPEGARMTRPHNTAVHPARYDTEAMLRIKRNLIATGQKRVWQALYQQDPLPDEGILFTKDMLRYGNFQRRSDWMCYQAWDFSITEKRMSDWIACTTGFVTPEDDIIIADVMRFKVDEDGSSLVEAMIDKYVEFKANEIGVEDGQIWKSIKTLFQKRCRERRVYPSVRVLTPLTDKVVRAGPLRGRMQMGKVFIQKNRPWNEAFISELLHFPGGKHDDMCFVGETLITMGDGSKKRIDRINDGDMVATPFGPREVIACGYTGIKSVYKIAGLIATAEHPVFVDGVGWKPLITLIESDRLHALESQGSGICRAFTKRLRRTSKRLSSTVRNIVDTLTRHARTFVATSLALAGEGSFIATSGSFTTDQFLREATSTTWTRTTSTMTSQTSPVSQRKNTRRSIIQSSLSMLARISSELTLKISGLSPRLGTLLKKAAHGIRQMARTVTRTARKVSVFVRSAVARLSLSNTTPSFVRSLARIVIGTKLTQVTRLPRLLGERRVYNLTVSDAHCYYANGVLVHNCDSTAWMVRVAMEHTPKKDRKMPEPKSWKDKINKLGRGSVSHMAA